MRLAWDVISQNHETWHGKPYDNREKDMRILISETAKQYLTPFNSQPKVEKRKMEISKDTDLRTKEDKRVDEDKWLHGMDVYEKLVAEGRLIGHRGNPDNIIRSTYWVDRRDGSVPADMVMLGREQSTDRPN